MDQYQLKIHSPDNADLQYQTELKSVP